MGHTLAVILATLAISITSTLTAPVVREFNELETPKNTLFTRGNIATNCLDFCLGDGAWSTGTSSLTDSQSSSGEENWGVPILLNQSWAVTGSRPDPPHPRTRAQQAQIRASRALAARRAAVLALPKPRGPPDPEATARAQRSLADYRAAAVASRRPVRRVGAVAIPRHPISHARATRLLAAHQGVALADQDDSSSSGGTGGDVTPS